MMIAAMATRLKRSRVRKLVFVVLAIIVAPFIYLFLLGGPTFQKAPYPLPISPMVAYRITGDEHDIRFFANDPNSIRGFAIVQREVIADSRLQQDVVDVLGSRLIYGSEDILCFEPGIAVRMGEGQGEVDALICLTCRRNKKGSGRFISKTFLTPFYSPCERGTTQLLRNEGWPSWPGPTVERP
jgi:hypothetical protein